MYNIFPCVCAVFVGSVHVIRVPGIYFCDDVLPGEDAKNGALLTMIVVSKELQYQLINKAHLYNYNFHIVSTFQSSYK